MSLLVEYLVEQLLDYGPLVAGLSLVAWDIRRQLILCQQKSDALTREFLDHLMGE